MAQRQLTMAVEAAVAQVLPVPGGQAGLDGRRHAGAVAGRPVLTMSGVVKQWRTLPDPVLRGVSLSLEPGSAVHILGRNGAGKTTLLRVIAGLIKPDRGALTMDGTDPEHDRVEYQRRIGFLPAGDRGLYARLSVVRHLDLWARVSFVPKATRRIAVDRAVERFGLEPLKHRRVDRLSMGQRQRLRLAGLLLHAPRLLLLDEPRNSLDDEGVSLMVEVLHEQLQAGGAVLWCSPSGEQPGGLPFDRAFALTDGRLERR